MNTHTVKTVSIETELTCEQIVKAVNGYNDLIIAIKTALICFDNEMPESAEAELKQAMKVNRHC